MVETYFEIGRLIVIEEQNGTERAEYGKQIIIELSSKLTKEFGLGFSVTNLQQMKNFFCVYGKQQTVSAKSDSVNIQLKSDFRLSWSHYLESVHKVAYFQPFYFSAIFLSRALMQKSSILLLHTNLYIN